MKKGGPFEPPSVVALLGRMHQTQTYLDVPRPFWLAIAGLASPVHDRLVCPRRAGPCRALTATPDHDPTHPASPRPTCPSRPEHAKPSRPVPIRDRHTVTSRSSSRCLYHARAVERPGDFFNRLQVDAGLFCNSAIPLEPRFQRRGCLTLQLRRKCRVRGIKRDISAP